MSPVPSTLEIDANLLTKRIQILTFVFNSIVGQIQIFNVSDREGVGEFRTKFPSNSPVSTFFCKDKSFTVEDCS